MKALFIKKTIKIALQEVFLDFPQIILVVLFGSLAEGTERPDSDLDIAVEAQQPLTVDERIALIQALAEKIGRPVDLIDLTSVGQPLLGKIIQHGQKIYGSNTQFGNLIYRNLIEQADFVPYQNRIIAERRMAWIGK